MTMRHATLLASVLAVGSLAAGASHADEAALRKEALRAEIALAESKLVYAVLDPSVGEMRLELGNVVLHRFPAVITVGAPRHMDGAADRWPALVFTIESGMPQMERPTIVPPGADSTAAVADTTQPAPPTENLLEQRDRMIASVPAHYTLVFTPALEMIIAGEPDPRSTWDTLRERLSNALARLRKQELPMRVRLEMSPEDARRFGLALREDMQLLVLPPVEVSGG